MLGVKSYGSPCPGAAKILTSGEVARCLERAELSAPASLPRENKSSRSSPGGDFTFDLDRSARAPPSGSSGAGITEVS